ncbi:MAG: hypothetical protein H7210_05155 [Pyrinomonadaceae bacterium]|nr:hypothetical protein [Phycisphaerales bacterium]
MSSSGPVRLTLRTAFAASALTFAAAPALAQPTVHMFTIDCGGQVSTGGTLRLTSTIAQPDATALAAHTGGVVSMTGGFWAVALPRCSADINNDGIISSQDFFDFISAFFSGNPSADFNGDGAITSQDFFDFIAAFFGGCQ